jgi:hypothetical protein
MMFLALLTDVSAWADHSVIDRCKSHLSQGRASLASGDFKQAIVQFRKGIQLMGLRYLNSAVNDDTGMRLTLAEIQEGKAHFQESANLYSSVLANRISIWEAKQKPLPAAAKQSQNPNP